MFWKFGFFTPSALDAVLDKEEFTLEELLEQEDVLQEVKNQHKRLTEYLSTQETIARLLKYALNEPPADQDEKTRFKLPNLACEILACDNMIILDALTSNDNLSMLFAVLEQPAPLHPLVASFFCKIVSTLAAKKAEDLMVFVRDSGTVLPQILKHLCTPAIADVLQRLLCAETMASWAQKWLVVEENLISRLFEIFTCQEARAADQLTNLSIMIEDLICFCRQEGKDMQEDSAMLPVKTALLSEANNTRLLQLMFDHVDIALEPGVRILRAFIDEPPRGEDEPPLSEEERAEHHEEIKHVLQALVPHTNKIDSVLRTRLDTSIHTASGVIDQPLGIARTKLVHLLSAVISADAEQVVDELIAHKTLDLLLDLFLQFENNNILHNYVHEAVLAVCTLEAKAREADSTAHHRLFVHLVAECTYLPRIMETWEENKQAQLQRNGMRRGYMGYLTMIANGLAQLCGPECQFVPGILANEMQDQWCEFVSGDLTAQLGVLTTVLGGKRPVMEESSDEESFYGTFERAESNLEIDFDRFLKQQLSEDLPNPFEDDDTDDDDDLSSEFSLAGDQSDGRLGDAPPWLSEQDDVYEIAEQEDAFRFSWDDAAPAPAPAAAPAATSAAPDIVMNAASDSDASHSSGEDSDDEISGSYTLGKSPAPSPRKVVSFPLSPQGAAAVANMPTEDPYAIATGGEQGWANFDDAPQAMDMQNASLNEDQSDGDDNDRSSSDNESADSFDERAVGRASMDASHEFEVSWPAPKSTAPPPHLNLDEEDEELGEGAAPDSNA